MSFAASAERRPKTLIVGLGNPILGDDGVGWRIAESLERRLRDDDAVRTALGPVEVDELAVGGLRLMERLVGYDRVVLADAQLDGATPGTVSARPIGEVDCRLAGHLDSAHDATLTAALAAGGRLGAQLPADLTVVTVTIEPSIDFGERLSPRVAAAVEPAVDAIIEALRRPRSPAH
jgi:hydrogenase maturation protease